MTVIADAGPLVAFVDSSDPRHRETRAFIERTEEALYVSPFALAEADHFVCERTGLAGELTLLADVMSGAFLLEPMSGDDVGMCLDVIRRYRDLDIRLADASIVVLADRRRTNRVLTFDERHFRALRDGKGEPFVLLPADERPTRTRRR